MENFYLSDEVTKYIKEEVERQGYDIETVEGEARVFEMIEAWYWAKVQSIGKPRPTYDDIVNLGKMIERERNHKGIRRVEVTIAGVRTVEVQSKDVKDRLERLVGFMDVMTSEEVYLEFEFIHPFVDGNGRVGKIVYNWVNQTLDSPVLPPDFFGDGVP